MNATETLTLFAVLGPIISMGIGVAIGWATSPYKAAYRQLSNMVRDL